MNTLKTWVALGIMLLSANALAQDSAAQGADEFDDLQRSARIYNFRQAASEGPDRGQEIFYYKCWSCHNSFTSAAGSPGPRLELLKDRSVLMSGDPITDENIANKIRNGGPLMPAFKHTLTDADVDDLVAYISSGDCCIASGEVNLPANPMFTASADDTMTFDYKGNLFGGPTGKVLSNRDVPLEGIMVQLVAGDNNIRTTVYSNEAGEYEFPAMPAGNYTLRIARPLRWKPYRRNNVRIEGGAPKLADIVLERVTDNELLPPTPSIKAQMSGAEWLWNLPGTMEVKRTLVENCNWCHSYQQIFRTRYDEQGWAQIIDRMTHYQGSTLQVRNSRGRMEPDLERMLVKWLAEVRGPDSPDPQFKEMPYPTGPATEVVVREYELPRLYLATHDVAQTADDRLWYSPHRAPRVGAVNPATGMTDEYYVPVPDGCQPGTHWITVTNKNEVWSSQNWAHILTRIDPDTGDLHQIKPPPRLRADGTPRPCNMSMGGNWAVAPDGYIWKIRTSMVTKTDPETGKYVQTWPVKNVKGTYGTDVSKDNMFVGGGAWMEDWMIMLDKEKNEVVERESTYPSMGPGRSAFDPFGNLWAGGKGGALVRLSSETRRLKDFVAPLMYMGSFYEANADKNGEVWSGAVQTGRYVRLNPETEEWTVYVLPEPYSHNRKSWIDNSTDPVSLWYVDHNSYLVHIQPRE